MSQQKNQLFVHVPALLLNERLPQLLTDHLQPEVACQDVGLDQLDFPRLANAAQQLHEAGLRITLHAPYRDFSPGSNRPRARRRSLKLAADSLRLAEQLQASKVIFHPGIPARGDKRDRQHWLHNSLRFWAEFLPQAETIGTVLCLENIYEATPEWLLRVIEESSSPQLCHVFDVGHWNLFGRIGLRDWLSRSAFCLSHVHLHDNLGQSDEHLAIGQGNVPFGELFDCLGQQRLSPTLTLENHSPTALEESFAVLQRDYAFFC